MQKNTVLKKHLNCLGIRQTNEKTHGSDDSPSETDGCVRNLSKEHENEEDEEFKEDNFEINDTNEPRISKDET